MTRRTQQLLVGISASVGWTAPVLGGVIDSPLPVLGVGAAVHVFTVPGVIKNNNLATDFTCTNLSSSTIHIGVEVFPAAGGGPLNDASAPGFNGTGTVNPGATLTIGTDNTSGVHEDVVINLSKCKDGSVPGSLCNANPDCTGGGTCTALRCSTSPTTICTVDGDCAGGATCAPPLRNGSARIISDARSIVCNAFIVDKLSSPPTSMVQLKITKRKKQAGD